MTTIITFIFVLSFLVFVHELGHFLFAKRAGILVREFAIGFGPKIFSKVKGETLYSIRILPLGGFVRMAGEDGESMEFKEDAFVYATINSNKELQHLYLYEPNHLSSVPVSGKVVQADLEKDLTIMLEDSTGVRTTYNLDRHAFIHTDKKTHIQVAPVDRQFGSKTVGQKAMAIFAGPLFNIFLTIFLFGILVFSTGVDHQLKVKEVHPGKPASEVGIRVGDIIEEVNHKEIRPELPFFSYQIMSSKGKEVELGIVRDGQKITIPVTPVKVKDAYQVGVQLEQIKRKANFGQVITEAFAMTYDWTVLTVDTLGKLVTGQISPKNLGGPIMIGSATGKAAKLINTEAGFNPLIGLVALLSLNLGIFNLLPIPALDGSRLVFLGVEAIRGRPISPNKEGYIHLVGFALLMVFMIFVTYNDIMKLFS